MERKSIVIDIPDGMCIDESKSTFEKIVFKKKDTKPRSWEEYCSTAKEEEVRFCIEGVPYILSYGDVSCEQFKEYFKREEVALAFGAMMKLMNLREEWIGDWKPDWNKFEENKWCIRNMADKLTVGVYGSVSRSLSFPTQEMATEFMHCFKDLLEQAKELI